MKCQVIFMRRNGVAVPKWELRDAIATTGNLSISDRQDDGLYRVVKMARLMGESQVLLYVLFEPHVVWMHEGRFTLQGFERVRKEGAIVEYAQSWLCKVGDDPKPDDDEDYRRGRR